MRASGESLAVNDLRGATRDSVPTMGRELMLDTDSPTLSVTLPEDNSFCGECGQLLAGQTTATTWNGTAYPRWAWGLIALGVALTVMFGGTALAAARERAATQEILRTLP